MSKQQIGGAATTAAIPPQTTAPSICGSRNRRSGDDCHAPKHPPVRNRGQGKTLTRRTPARRKMSCTRGMARSGEACRAVPGWIHPQLQRGGTARSGAGQAAVVADCLSYALANTGSHGEDWGRRRETIAGLWISQALFRGPVIAWRTRQHNHTAARILKQINDPKFDR